MLGIFHETPAPDLCQLRERGTALIRGAIRQPAQGCACASNDLCQGPHPRNHPSPDEVDRPDLTKQALIKTSGEHLG